jgi:hypothetical protein
VTWDPPGRIGDQYTLNDAEQRLAQYLRNERVRADRSAGAKDGRCAPTGDIDLMGTGGELAFCRLHNVYPATDIVADGSWPTGDAVLGKVRVEVKTTEWERGGVLVPVSKGWRRVHAFALMTGRFPGPFTFRGFILRNELIVPERIKDPGHGRAYLAWQHELVEYAALADRYWALRNAPPPEVCSPGSA